MSKMCIRDRFNLFPQYTALENVTLAERLLAQETPEFKKDKKAILTRIDAVSYTHLDVYKRQSRGRTAKR